MSYIVHPVVYGARSSIEEGYSNASQNGRVFSVEFLRKAPYVEGGYNDIDPGLNPALQDHYRITPSPGGPGDQYGKVSGRARTEL